jgi:hypothetical protein
VEIVLINLVWFGLRKLCEDCKTCHRKVQELDLPSVGNSGTTSEFGFACSVVVFVYYCYTGTCRLTTGMCSEKCVVGQFHRCANVIECTYTTLDSIAYYTPRLYKVTVIKKVKVTFVPSLRHCTGRTAHRGSRGIALLYRH